MSFIIKGKKGLEPGERKIPTLVIGNRSTIPLPLDDPTVAPKHCAIHDVEGGYEIEDLGSATGTYLDGIVVAGRVTIPPGGGNIVVGHSRIRAEVDAGSGALILSVKESSFFYDRKNDPLEWVRSEVELGRYPFLRAGIVAAFILCLGLFGWAAFGTNTEEILEPGPTISAHQDAVREALSERRLQNACAACHDAWSGTPVSKCEACHQKKMADGVRYPFWTVAEWEAHGRGCEECHLEHQGEHAAGLYPKDFRSIWQSVDTTPGIRGSKPIDVVHDEVRLTYNTFSHQKHLNEKIPCDECHKSTADGEPREDGPVTREFLRITFEDCMHCHGPEQPRSEARARFHVAWHGTGEESSRCGSCHAKDHAAELRQVSREPSPTPGRVYEYVSDAHAPVIEEMASPDHPPIPEGRRCQDCHKAERLGGAERSGPFRHFTHLSGFNVRHNQQCVDCHQEVMSAKGLGPTRPAVPPEESCKACHRTSLPTRLETPGTRTRRVTDFPHDVHVRSSHALLAEGGCFACHEMKASGPHQSDALAATLPDTGNCTKCHRNHEHVGLVLGQGRPKDAKGDCVSCHLPGDPAWYGPSGSPEAPVTKMWPRNADFSHFSRGHENLECARCHDRVAEATDLRSLDIPDENHESCGPCHVQELFHWK